MTTLIRVYLLLSMLGLVLAPLLSSARRLSKMGWRLGVIETQRGHLFPWLAVAMSVGIGGYFHLRFEPQPWLLLTTLAAAILLCAISRATRYATGPIWLCLGVMCLGFVLAAGRAHHVSGPVLGWHYYGPIEGRVVGSDRSASDAVRVTLDRVVLKNVPPEKTPTRVRISLHGDADLGIAPQPGMRIMTTGHLSPPGGPVEPGGFDFQRHAWFLKLGGVGYTRVPIVGAAVPQRGWGLWVFRMRMTISQHVRAALPGDAGGFAAAVTTGDRSGMSAESLDALRAANTAHLLAISGLHMGLLCGFMFGLLRGGLALIPSLALRYSTKKIAAVGALLAASFYLALSGGNVSTERAYVMAAVALIAVLLDRRALSLRSVTLAALIVLTLRPEALLSPGFQMSFAATTALVAVFQHLRGVNLGFGVPFLSGAMGVLLSSAVAGLATAPIGAAHFNALAHYGLLANFLSVPLMGVLVIPAAVLAAALSPFGLDWIGLWLMGIGLDWILMVSHFVAGLEGARSFVPSPGPFVLPLMSFGVLFVIIWQGRQKWFGVLPVCAGLLLWTQTDRPTILIAEEASLVGVMTSEGRALSKTRGAGFVAKNWLENDGERLPQERAAARWALTNGVVQGLQIVHLSGKRAATRFEGCTDTQVVVSTHPIEQADCLVLTPKQLRKTGALAISFIEGRMIWTSVRDTTGHRMWSRWPEDTQPDFNERRIAAKAQ